VSTAASIVETEDDPTPIVLILAATLRRAERTPKLATAMRRTSGTVTLRSTVDPQAATIRFGGGRVRVERGAAPDTHVTIATDVNRMADEHPPKPTVTGAVRHLRLALTVAKVLEPPTGTWQDEARTFWAAVAGRPNLPETVLVVCTDDGTRLTLGPGEHDYEIHGSAHRLTALFTGGTVFGQEVLDGHLHTVGSLPQFAAITGASIDFMLGR
jgi:hypothetical protein